MNPSHSSDKKGNFGIIVSGGPAPGINGVISSAVIEATNHGYHVLGIKHGFRSLAEKEPHAATELKVSEVSRIVGTGGSILGTSRYNPFETPERKKNFLDGLDAHGIDKLIVVGGEGSAYLSSQLLVHAPQIKVVHVPKTIDNDLILPNHASSFGFETARYAGTRIINTISVDARTTERWFLVTSMGRKAGFLALGLGISSGATLTLIPEEYPEPIDINTIVDTIVSSIKHRKQMGRNHGVVIMAEGLIERIKLESVPELAKLPRDHLGRVYYAEIELGDLLAPRIRKACDALGLNNQITVKNIGYELRCHDPISFDIEYTRFLGVGAVRYLLEGRTGVMVCRDHLTLTSQSLQDLMAENGTIRSRTVNLDSDLYRIARSFMIR